MTPESHIDDVFSRFRREVYPAESASTRGRWFADLSNGFPIRVMSSNGAEVCRVGGSPDCPESSIENDANAVLIEESQALLKAAKDMAMWAAHFASLCGVNCQSSNPGPFFSRFCEAVATIERAQKP